MRLADEVDPIPDPVVPVVPVPAVPLVPEVPLALDGLDIDALWSILPVISTRCPTWLLRFTELSDAFSCTCVRPARLGDPLIALDPLVPDIVEPLVPLAVDEPLVPAMPECEASAELPEPCRKFVRM